MADKTMLSLSIDMALGERLRDLSRESGMAIAKIIAETLNEKLPDYEKRYSIQPRLDLQVRR